MVCKNGWFVSCETRDETSFFCRRLANRPTFSFQANNSTEKLSEACELIFDINCSQQNSA